jgi:putative addiction module component (TIGR02574 family)
VSPLAEARELLDEALKLKPEDRASIAAQLLESLEGAPEEAAAVEAAWALEIERRARRVLAGGSAGASRDEVRRRAEASLTRR